MALKLATTNDWGNDKDNARKTAHRDRPRSARHARVPVNCRPYGCDGRLRRLGAPRRRTLGRGRLRRAGLRRHPGAGRCVLAAYGPGVARDAAVRRQPHDQHRSQARHRPKGARNVRRRRCHHHQRRHDDLPDGGIPAEYAAEDPDQFLSARRISDSRNAEPRRVARRRGLPRPEADRRAVRRRRDPALFGAHHVHERDLDRPARRDRGRSADRARRDEAAAGAPTSWSCWPTPRNSPREAASSFVRSPASIR